MKRILGTLMNALIISVLIFSTACGAPYCLLRAPYNPPQDNCFQFHLADTATAPSAGQRATIVGGACAVTPLAAREGWMIDPMEPGPFPNFATGDAAMSVVSPYFSDAYGCHAGGTGTTSTTPTAPTTSTTSTTPTTIGIQNSIILLFDASGSMADNNKIDNAKTAAKNLAATTTQNDEMALIVFYDCNNIVAEQPFTQDKSALDSKIDSIQPIGGTPLHDAIAFAQDYMTKNAKGVNQKIITLTDGVETCQSSTSSQSQ